MNIIFSQQIGPNLEVFVDDMIVKNSEEQSHLIDMEDISRLVRKFNMRLHPAKCLFGE